MNRLAVGWLARSQQAKKVEICYKSSNGLMTFQLYTVICIQTNHYSNQYLIWL